MKNLIQNIEKLGFKNNILEQLSQEIKGSGFAGNTNIPELVYLAMCTSMLNNPMSIVLKGPSGAGKSFNLNAGKQFIPETAYSQFEGMSEKALVYLNNLEQPTSNDN